MRFNPFKRSTPAPPSPEPTTPSISIDEKLDNDFFAQQDADALDVVADDLYRMCWPLGWVPSTQIPSADWNNEVVLGVSIRSTLGSMRSCPVDHAGMAEFEDAAAAFNVVAALKMRSKAVEYIIKNYIANDDDLFELYINANTRIQILPSMAALPAARRSQYAALIRDECVLVVWADSVDSLIPTTQVLEHSLITLVRTGRPRSRAAERATDTEKSATESSSDGPSLDTEKGQSVQVARSHAAIAAVMGGLAMMLLVVLCGIGLTSILVRYLYDGDMSRFALVAVFLPTALLAAFPVNFLISSLFAIFGPISQYNQNSTFFSAVAPSRANVSQLLPITVQMPVYKESLDDVLIPTIESLKIAMTTYERQGGTVNLLVCDDGLQLVSENDARARIQYYIDNDIAYVARPPPSDTFQRRGKFKKAGNLNYANKLSLDIEEEMDKNRPEPAELGRRWTESDEKVLYSQALTEVLARYDGKTWAEGNVRIGEIILLVDSDTRVPADCFMDASLEMTESPEVAIIQHESGVMQVAHHFFENGMAFFTDMIQIGISMTVAGGSVSPFVGHNAFLRWAALQESAFIDPFDGQKRVWSEEHVSEDFQISLNLQTKGWIIRWATYAKGQFQEGVSLTCVDELSRWQKYAWGCSEIVFNPIRYWPTRGPITKLFRTFLWSNMAPHSKLGILAYMFSYYAISSAWIGTIISFVLVGVFAWSDTFYVTSWNSFFICILLFQGLNNVSMIILRYRLKFKDGGRFAVQVLVWIPFFAVFFTGLSIPVAASMICHLLSINMSWTTTSKSVEKSNVFVQLPKILAKFWLQLSFSVIVLAGMIVSTTSIVPIQYRVSNITAIIPLALVYGGHLVWPFVLDPYLTTFSY